VWVASRCSMHHRGTEPHEGVLPAQRSGTGHTLQWSPSPREEEMVFRTPDPGTAGKTSEVGSQDQDQRGRIQPIGFYRLYGDTLKDRQTT
jgi:hypothetical protein